MAGTEGFGVVRKERVDRAEEAVLTERAAEDRLQTEGEVTEVARQVDVGFTAEEAAALVEGAVVGVDAAFELEADLHAVAEVFGTGDAPARGGVDARGHFEVAFTVGGMSNFIPGVTPVVFVGIGQTGVDHAVERDIRGLRGSGGAENGERDERLLHDLDSFL